MKITTNREPISVLFCKMYSKCILISAQKQKPFWVLIELSNVSFVINTHNSLKRGKMSQNVFPRLKMQKSCLPS